MPTKIEWARNADGSPGETWNPIRAKLIDGKRNVSKSGHFGTGCTMVSPGCQNCYAGTINKRFYGNDYSYHSKPAEFFLDEKILGLPMRKRKPTTFFVCSMCDLFHEGVPNEMIAEIFGVMSECEQHTFQVLTKRAKRMQSWFGWVNSQWSQLFPPHHGAEDYPVDANVVLQFVNHLSTRAQEDVCKDDAPLDWPLPNVWLGVSAENQEMADSRIPILLKIPAAVRWVSFEPLLGPINYISGIDWAVVGGESGPKARPMHPDWARSLRDQCLKVGIPFFYKQWGAWGPVDRGKRMNPTDTLRFIIAPWDSAPGDVIDSIHIMVRHVQQTSSIWDDPQLWFFIAAMLFLLMSMQWIRRAQKESPEYYFRSNAID